MCRTQTDAENDESSLRPRRLIASSFYYSLSFHIYPLHLFAKSLEQLLPRKGATGSPGLARNRTETAEPRPSKAAASHQPGAMATDDLTRLALKACLIARDAAFNVRDLVTSNSRMAFLAIKDCEKELDHI